jgi:hypothetical protein
MNEESALHLGEEFIREWMSCAMSSMSCVCHERMRAFVIAAAKIDRRTRRRVEETRRYAYARRCESGGKSLRQLSVGRTGKTLKEN